MVRISFVKTDPELRESGHTFTYVPGFTTTVTCMPNQRFNDFLRKRSKVMRRAKAGQVPEPEVVEEITKEAFARFVMLGWDGLEDDDGQPIEFSWEKALEFFKEDDWAHYYARCQAEAGDQANFRLMEEEEDVGN